MKKHKEMGNAVDRRKSKESEEKQGLGLGLSLVPLSLVPFESGRFSAMNISSELAETRGA